MKSMIKNRRRHKRFRANLEASFIFARSGGEIKGTGTARIKDMSYEGARLRTDIPLEDKPYCLIEMDLDVVDTSIAATGRIMWVDKSPGSRDCGLKLNWCSDKSAYTKFLDILKEVNAAA